MRPTKAVINLSNLRENYLNIRKRAGSKSVIPVIKADAYGHGAVRIAHFLNSVETDNRLTFAVAIAEEAVTLRNAGITNPILVFENFSENNIREHLEFNLIPTIADRDGLQLLKRLQSDLSGHDMKAAIKFDTGMGRLGFPLTELQETAQVLSQLKAGSIHSVYTHFSAADEADLSFTYDQVNTFKLVVAGLKEQGIAPELLHHSNSAGILNLDDDFTNAVRLGISLYGYYPSEFTSRSVPLRPVMSLISEVATIRYFEQGEYVSYGRRFGVTKRSNIATLPVGYADGVPRTLTGKFSVMSKMNTYPQVGTITMDRIMIDCGDSPVNKNDKVILFGEDYVSADHWAALAGTISYEITCGISARVPREYIE